MQSRKTGGDRRELRFRIESTGESGGEKRSIIATFTHPGYLNYVYLTNFEVQDPILGTTEPKICEKYYPERKEEGHTTVCPPIEFTPEDKVKGPMHTNDASAICATSSQKPTFGRSSADKIEMNKGNYKYPGCSSDPYEKGTGMVGTYTENGPTLLPPETDSELLESAEYKFRGKTIIDLKSGTPNTMEVTTYVGSQASTETMLFPKNGVVFVETSTGGCGVTYTPFNSDYEHDTGCGNVYVRGSYTESLTIAAANDVIINGNIETTHESSGKPTGDATLGLIATNFVRIYHPVKQGEKLKTKEPKTEKGVGSKEETCATILKMKGKITKNSKEVTGLSRASVETFKANETEISGSGIPSGTKVATINSNKTSVVLSKEATKTEEPELTFTTPTGFEYHSGQKLCVEKGPTGYEYHESETLYAEKCGSGATYTSKGYCEYENNSSACSSKATSLNASEDPNHWGSINNLVIDAAILSTKHSFIFDNYLCGGSLGELTIWGALAQYWRGIVYEGGRGYIKNYNYDERLETDQPPNFLSPSTTSWKLTRETAPPTS
jgi:hypothetical protein